MDALELLSGDEPFIADTLIAAAAEHGGIAVLHRDTHFDKLAEVLAFQGVQLPGS